MLTRPEYDEMMSQLWSDLEQSEKDIELAKKTKGADQPTPKYATCGRVRNRWGLPVRYVAMSEVTKHTPISCHISDINQINKQTSFRDYFNVAEFTLAINAKNILAKMVRLLICLKPNASAWFDDLILKQYPGAYELMNYIDKQSEKGASTNDDVLDMFSAFFMKAGETELEPLPEHIRGKNVSYMCGGKNVIFFIMKDFVPDKENFGLKWTSIINNDVYMLTTAKESNDLYDMIMVLRGELYKYIGKEIDFSFSIDELMSIFEFRYTTEEGEESDEH